MVEIIYRPKLSYLFCVANYRSLWPQLSVIRYLNGLGIEPYALVDTSGAVGDSMGMLKGSHVRFVLSPDRLPDDYDVMFSQSAGLDDFERASLVNSWKRKKTNVKLHNSMSTYNVITNINYIPARVRGKVHGFCMKEQRAINHYRRFLTESDAWMLNVGDPDWDYFQTEGFKNNVQAVRAEYGDKLLLVCASLDSGLVESSFWEIVIPWATAKGFRVMLRTHPGCEHRVTGALQQYKAPELHRHVLFAAASHVIGEMSSSVIGECMLLGTKVGSYPFVPHTPRYGVHSWMDNDTAWREAIVRHIGPKMLFYVPFVHTSGSLAEFLNSDEPLISEMQMNELWGWPRVPCYSSYLLECLERKLGA